MCNAFGTFSRLPPIILAPTGQIHSLPTLNLSVHQDRKQFVLHYGSSKVEESAEYFIEEGLEYERDQDFYNAVHSYEKALEIDPNNLVALVLCGELHSYQNLPDYALQCFERVLNLDLENRIVLEYRRILGEKY